MSKWKICHLMEQYRHESENEDKPRSLEIIRRTHAPPNKETQDTNRQKIESTQRAGRQS